TARPVAGTPRPARSASPPGLASTALQLFGVDRHAALTAAHALDHGLVARLALQPDGRRPRFEYLLELGEVLGLGRHRQRLGHVVDEALPVVRADLAEQLDGVGGQLEVV